MTAIESERRRQTAFEAIKNAFGTDSGEDSINLFVEHHIQELPPSYWQQHLNVDAPDPQYVVNLLILRSAWGKDDIEYFDFTLPDDVTDYVISVHFDPSGNIVGMSMES